MCIDPLLSVLNRFNLHIPTELILIVRQQYKQLVPFVKLVITARKTPLTTTTRCVRLAITARPGPRYLLRTPALRELITASPDLMDQRTVWIVRLESTARVSTALGCGVIDLFNTSGVIIIFYYMYMLEVKLLFSSRVSGGYWRDAPVAALERLEATTERFS